LFRSIFSLEKCPVLGKLGAECETRTRFDHLARYQLRHPAGSIFTKTGVKNARKSATRAEKIVISRENRTFFAL